MGHRRHRHRAPPTRGHRQPRHRDGRGRDRGLHRRGPQRGRAAALLRRRPRRVRRARPAQVPLRRPAAAAYAAQPPPPGAGQRRAPAGHGPPGLRRDRDAAALGPDPRGLAGVLRPVAPAPRLLLRAAPEPAAGQAAPHGGRLRPLLPDRPLPAGRGPQGRPPVRVHAARPGVLLRLPGRRHGLRLRSRDRRRRGGDGGAAATDCATRRGPSPGTASAPTSPTCASAWSWSTSPTSSPTPRSRPSRHRPSRPSSSPRAPPSRARRLDDLTEQAKKAGAAGLAWFRVVPDEDGTAPRSTDHWRATSRSRKRRAS